MWVAVGVDVGVICSCTYACILDYVFAVCCTLI